MSLDTRDYFILTGSNATSIIGSTLTPRNIHILLVVLKMTRTSSSLTLIDSLRSLSSTTFDSFKLYLDFFLSSNVSLWLYLLFVLVFTYFIFVQVWKNSTPSLYHGCHVIRIHDVTRKTRKHVQSYITLCIGLLFTFRSVQMSQLLQCKRRLSECLWNVRLVVMATFPQNVSIQLSECCRDKV